MIYALRTYPFIPSGEHHSHAQAHPFIVVDHVGHEFGRSRYADPFPVTQFVEATLLRKDAIPIHAVSGTASQSTYKEIYVKMWRWICMKITISYLIGKDWFRRFSSSFEIRCIVRRLHESLLLKWRRPKSVKFNDKFSFVQFFWRKYDLPYIWSQAWSFRGRSSFWCRWLHRWIWISYLRSEIGWKSVWKRENDAIRW